MKTVLLAHDMELDAPWARRCRLRDRVRAHLSALTLDQELAAGACPDSEVLLSLRAEKLISMANRHDVARALRRIVADAGRPVGPVGPVLPLARRSILRHGDVIRQLAAVLDRPGPIDVRGLATVEVLLKDGAGPLYTDDSHDALGPRLKTALAILSTPPAGSAVA